jgi:hypothetical protein
MSLLADWRLTRERRRRAALYLAALRHDVAPSDIAWLARLTTPLSEKVALRELLFARRAVALIVSERDALDDRTASDVAHELAAEIAAEGRHDSAAPSAWHERWRTYTGALAARGSTEAPAVRLARVMLQGAGVTNPGAAELQQGTQYISVVRSAANEALRKAFGAASLPDDVRPSALGAGPR